MYTLGENYFYIYSYIVSLNHVKQFNRNESILIMENGEHLPIARNQKEKLVEKYGWL
ncbi:MAG: LytTR family transcriptional regulator DNA-binding domain-containing protein [Bacteroidota bacterium]|nr:LytTR family transcriptional regulator DNA-binding domain-containing protein [Bacteroidota bacterium]